VLLKMHIFYCPNIISNSATLSPEESVHCIRVIRLGKGDVVMLIDGKGGMFEAVISEPDARQCRLEITGALPIPPARNFNLHIAIAPTKNMDRFEWFVEKAVEIGISTITPLLCQRSERRILRTDRLQKLIISTMKQAIVPYLPVLHELTNYNEFIHSITGSKSNLFIAHCQESEKKMLINSLTPRSDVIILIGPEGDFSPGEIKLATTNKFIPVSLGPNRLRTETAGIVACNTFILLNDMPQLAGLLI
jgi:16S rRNA (uracil1498-N3)-methyltransferase